MIHESWLLDLAKGIEKRQNFDSMLRARFAEHGLKMLSATLGRNADHAFWSILIQDCSLKTYKLAMDNTTQLYSLETLQNIVQRVLEFRAQER